MERRTFVRCILTAGGIPLVGSAAYAFRSNFIEISRERLVVPVLKNKLRIVTVSDVHAPSFFGSLGKITKIVNLEFPDIFILAGDTIDRRGSEGLVRSFKSVKARLAKLSILGNWEYRGRLDLATLKKEYEKAGFSLLVNKGVDISGLTIVGLDDFVHGSPEYSVLKRIPTRLDPLLVISHCPESFDFLTCFPDSALIVLSGHTHGGQIVPFGIVFYRPPGSGSYLQGWYYRGKHSMYVMRGIGTSSIPLRIGARPEVLVLDLEGTKA